MKANYIVVQSDFFQEFELEVNKKIEEGYKPQGAVTVVHLKNVGEVFYQAMVLENKPNF